MVAAPAAPAAVTDTPVIRTAQDLQLGRSPALPLVVVVVLFRLRHPGVLLNSTLILVAVAELVHNRRTKAEEQEEEEEGESRGDPTMIPLFCACRSSFSHCGSCGTGDNYSDQPPSEYGDGWVLGRRTKTAKTFHSDSKQRYNRLVSFET